jgi:hypothetical protein
MTTRLLLADFGVAHRDVTRSARSENEIHRQWDGAGTLIAIRAREQAAGSARRAR